MTINNPRASNPDLLTSPRYHSANSLRRMRAFRIARIEPCQYTNLLPPIRGGVYLKVEESQELPENTDDVTSLSDDDDDDALSIPHSIFSTSHNSSTTSLSALSRITNLDELQDASCKASIAEEIPDTHSEDGFPVEYGLRLRSPLRDPKSYSEALLKGPSFLATTHLTSPNAFTSRMIQKEIDRDVFTYPQVDESTQRDITLKYKALHQRVKHEGFYDCQYLEYGKEICRYTLLFSLFIVSLRCKWYITSACFLGAFWVKIVLPRLEGAC